MIYRWREAAFNLTVLQRYCLRSRRKNILRMNEKKKTLLRIMHTEMPVAIKRLRNVQGTSR